LNPSCKHSGNVECIRELLPLRKERILTAFTVSLIDSSF